MGKLFLLEYWPVPEQDSTQGCKNIIEWNKGWGLTSLSRECVGSEGTLTDGGSVKLSPKDSSEGCESKAGAAPGSTWKV